MWSRLAPNSWSQVILWLWLPSSWKLQGKYYHAQTLHLINNLGIYLPGIAIKICTERGIDPSDLLFISFLSFFFLRTQFHVAHVFLKLLRALKTTLNF